MFFTLFVEVTLPDALERTEELSLCLSKRSAMPTLVHAAVCWAHLLPLLGTKGRWSAANVAQLCIGHSSPVCSFSGR